MYPALAKALAESQRRKVPQTAAAMRHADSKQLPAGRLTAPNPGIDQAMVRQPPQMPPQPAQSFGTAPDGTPVQPVDLHFVHPHQDKLDSAFRNTLDDVSDRMGQDLTITSGYRGPGHPVEARKPGGPGMHSTGRAADISMAGMDDATRAKLIRALHGAGVSRFGAYTGSPNMLHVDLKDQHGNGTPHFMFDRTVRNMGNAPDYFRNVAGDLTGQPVPNQLAGASPSTGSIGTGAYPPAPPDPSLPGTKPEPAGLFGLDREKLQQNMAQWLENMGKQQRYVPRTRAQAPQNTFMSGQTVPWLASRG